MGKALMLRQRWLIAAFVTTHHITQQVTNHSTNTHNCYVRQLTGETGSPPQREKSEHRACSKPDLQREEAMESGHLESTC